MSPGQHRGRPLAKDAASSKAVSPAKDLSSTSMAVYASGLDQAISNAAGDWWTSGAMLAIRQLAMTGRGFDADHVITMCGMPSDGHYVGAVFAAAQRSKIIEAVGCRVAADGRLLRVWWGAPQGGDS